MLSTRHGPHGPSWGPLPPTGARHGGGRPTARPGPGLGLGSLGWLQQLKLPAKKQPVCIYICRCMHLHMRMYIYIHTHIHIYTYIYIYRCVYVFFCTELQQYVPEPIYLSIYLSIYVSIWQSRCLSCMYMGEWNGATSRLCEGLYCLGLAKATVQRVTSLPWTGLEFTTAIKIPQSSSTSRPGWLERLDQ